MAETASLIKDAALEQALLESNVARAMKLFRDGANVNTQTPAGVTLLILATLNGDTSSVTELLKNANIDINAVRSDGMSALMIACNTRNLDIVEALLAKGANPNLYRIKDGYNALTIAGKAMPDKVTEPRAYERQQRIMAALQTASVAGAQVRSMAEGGSAAGAQGGRRKRKTRKTRKTRRTKRNIKHRH